MIVYRFERGGIGPYVSRSGMILLRGRKATKTQKKYVKLRNHYWEHIDERVRDDNWRKAHADRKYMFGCSSKQQLRAYFGGEFKELFKMGFRIKRYKVPDDQVLNMGMEVAFPVRYHKFQTTKKVQEKAYH